jgi:hypothetical protein
MKSESFTYWLNGFFELSGSNELNQGQVQIIKDHLALVFKKETPVYQTWAPYYCCENCNANSMIQGDSIESIRKQQLPCLKKIQIKPVSCACHGYGGSLDPFLSLFDTTVSC